MSGLNKFANSIIKENSGTFIVKNRSPDNKTINIFGVSIPYNRETNLLKIRGVSENEIRTSLLKGELRNKLLSGDIEILSSDIDLLQFNVQQKSFLSGHGVVNGLEIPIPQPNIYNSTVLVDRDGNGDFTDWDQLMSFIETINRPAHIYFTPGTTYTVPANSTPYNLKNSIIEFPLGDASSSSINVEDGATLLNLSQGHGAFGLIGNSTDPSKPTLDFSSFSNGFAVYLQQFGNYLSNLGSSPMIIVPDNCFFVLAERYGGGINPANTTQVIQIGDNSTALLTVIGSPMQLPDDSIVGLSSSTIIFQQDGSMTSFRDLNLPSFSGSIFNFPFGSNAGRGPTNFRPLPLLGPITTGTVYYDTDLQRPIWYDATNDKWLDAVGSGV